MEDTCVKIGVRRQLLVVTLNTRTPRKGKIRRTLDIKRGVTSYSVRELPEYDNTRSRTVIFGESAGQDNGVRSTGVTGIARPANRSISSKKLRLAETATRFQVARYSWDIF